MNTRASGWMTPADKSTGGINGNFPITGCITGSNKSSTFAMFGKAQCFNS
jgi:hypothetical protein